MVDVSGISKASILGRALRLPLRLIPAGSRLPILQGRLRGRWWIVGSGNHGCWLGSYEYQKRLTFERTVVSGDIVYDIGANVGFYTLLASVLVGPTGRVFAFEPLQENIRFLRDHLGMNGIINAAIVEAAVSDCDGQSRFRRAANRAMGQLSPIGTVDVRTISIDSWVERGLLPAPTVIKMDIEGGEKLALLGAVRTLRTHQPKVFLATHSDTLHRECLEILRSLGYAFEAIGARPVEESDEILAQA